MTIHVIFNKDKLVGAIEGPAIQDDDYQVFVKLGIDAANKICLEMYKFLARSRDGSPYNWTPESWSTWKKFRTEHLQKLANSDKDDFYEIFIDYLINVKGYKRVEDINYHTW